MAFESTTFAHTTGNSAYTSGVTTALAMSNSSIFRRLTILASLVLCTSLSHADSVIKVFKTAKLKVTIRTASVPDSSGHFSTGMKGLLEIEHGGHGYVWKQIDKQTNHVDVPLENVVVGASSDPPAGGDTFYKVTGGTYKLEKETTIKMKKAGVEITIPANTIVNLNLPDKLSLNLSAGNGSVVKTPVGGTQVTLSELTLEKGGYYGSGTLHMVDANLPGVSVGNAVFDWNLGIGSEVDPSSKFSISQVGAADMDIAIDLPGIGGTESNPCTLKVKGFKLNDDGDTTFTSGTLVAPPAGIRIPLANPANFAIILYSGTITMADGELTSLAISGGVELPPDFAPEGINSAVVIPVNFTIDDGSEEQFASASPVLLKKKMRLLIKKHLPKISVKMGEFKLTVAAGDYAIDLAKKGTFDSPYLVASSPALDPAWMGIIIKKATLEFPKEFGTGSTVEVTNVLIGPGGLNGNFSANNFKVPYFPNSTLTTLSGTFLQGRLTSCTGKGKIHIADLKSDLTVGVTVTGSGAFTLTAEQGQSVPVDAFGGKVSIQVDHGTFKYDDATDSGAISLAGSLTFADSVPSLGGTTLGFQDLTISTAGKVSVKGGYVDLPHPVKVPLGPVSITLEQFGIVTHTETQPAYSSPAIKLTGSVTVSDDLPINGSVGFDGLTIYKNSANDLKVDWESISLDIAIDKIGSLHAEIEKGDFPDSDYTAFLNANPAVPSKWRNHAPVTWLKGEGKLTLDCLKAGSIDIEFLAAPKAWYVSINVPLPNGIKLGNSGLALFAFTGGLGRNVTSYSGDSGMVGVPNIDYDLIPLPPDIPAGTPNWDKKWLFKAGTTIGTVDKYTVWGDVVLTASIGTSSFFIDLDGKFYILQTMAPATRANPDRYAHVNLHYDSTLETFTATATADLYFPTKASSVLHAYAPISLLISPTAKHFYIGGNIQQNPGSRPTMTDPAILAVGPFSGQGVMMLDFPNSQGVYLFKTGGIIGASLSFEADLNWCKLSGGLSADAYFYCDASLLAPTATTPLKFNGANGQIGLEAALYGDARIGKLSWGFSATGHADISAYLDPNYKLSGTGTLAGSVAFGKFHKGFTKGFSF